MQEIQVIHRCDFCTAALDGKKGSQVGEDIAVGGVAYLVDSCAACRKRVLGPVVDAISAHSRPGAKVKRRKRRTREQIEAARAEAADGMLSCPDCGQQVKGRVGMGIHRSKKHGYVSPERRTA